MLKPNCSLGVVILEVVCASSGAASRTMKMESNWCTRRIMTLMIGRRYSSIEGNLITNAKSLGIVFCFGVDYRCGGAAKESEAWVQFVFSATGCAIGPGGEGSGGEDAINFKRQPCYRVSDAVGTAVGAITACGHFPL